jgi:hypothetical protein
MTDNSSGRELPVPETDNLPQMILAVVWGVVLMVSTGLIYLAAGMFGYL